MFLKFVVSASGGLREPNHGLVFDPVLSTEKGCVMKVNSITNGRSILGAGLSVLISSLLIPAIVSAATFTWDGGGAPDVLWTTGTNWVGDAAPASANTTDIVFTTPASGSLTTVINGNTTVRSIAFTSGVTGDENRIRLDVLGSGSSPGRVLNFAADSGNASITVAAGATAPITFGLFEGAAVRGSMTLGSDLDIVHNGSGTLFLGRPISGAGRSLTKTGSGTMVLKAAMTYTGTLELGAGQPLASGSSLSIGGGSFDMAGYNLTTNTLAAFAITSGSIFSSNNNAGVSSTVTAATYSLSGGTVGGGIGPFALGAGTMTVSGSTTLNAPAAAGVININSGTLTLGSSGSFTGATAAIAVASGASLDAVTPGGFSLVSGQTLGGAGTIVGDLFFDSGSKIAFSTSNTLTISSGTASFAAGFGIDDLVGLDGNTVAENTYTLLAGTVDPLNLDNVGFANRVSIGGGKEAYFAAGSLQVLVVPEPALGGIAACLAAAGLARRLRKGCPSLMGHQQF